MHSVTIHKYTSILTAIEFGQQQAAPENFLIVVAGLADGFLSVPYVPALAEAVSARFGQKWVLVQALINSSYLGFGTGSLNRDCKDLSRLVKYLRENRGHKSSKVILMGHSTGCQDVMEYLTKFSNCKSWEPSMAIDGGVLQAPVSDREGIRNESNSEELDQLLSLAKEFIKEGKGKEMLPLKATKYTFGSPVNAYRFDALLSVGGDDDYFSSDLPHEVLINLFGKIALPVLFLPGEKDEFVPSTVNKGDLLDSWKKACNPSVWSPHSKILPGATHKIDEGSAKESQEILIDTVLSYIKDTF